MLSVLAAALAVASTIAPHGVVYRDTNANGVRDAGEAGMAGVVVSNQDEVVVTGSDGTFRLTSAGTGIVFVAVPDGWSAVGSFWRAAGDSSGAVDFPLARRRVPREFTFIHASDTHVDAHSVERTARLRALVDSLRPAFVLITGDLVRDALRVGDSVATSYYTLFAAEARRFTAPVYTVPGNHENFGIERDRSHVSATHPLYGRGMYRRWFGPDYYSFTFGGIHFVGLNTVDIDDQSYYGHVDSLQLAWLARDLAHVPASMPVVTFDHIPFATSLEMLGGYRDDPPAPTLITIRGKTQYRHTVSNAGEVIALLRGHPFPLALGGHLHAGERLEYLIDGRRTRFNLTPAIVASTDEAGLHFPSGLTLYRLRNGRIDEGTLVELRQE